MSNTAALGGSIGRTTTSYLPRTAAAAMRIQDGRTPLCACPVHRRMPMQKVWSISSKPLMSPAPQPAAQDGDGLSSSTHQWCIRKKVATFLCNMSTKPTRAPAEIGAALAPCRRNRPVLHPSEMGCPDTALQPAAQGVTSAARALPKVTETSSGCAASCWTGPGSWVCEPVIFTQMWENNRLTATQIHYGGCTHSGK